MTTTPRRRRRLLTSLLATAAVATMASGCAGVAKDAQSGGRAAVKGGTLTVAFGFPPQSLDPGQNGNGGQNIVQWLTYEPLIRAKSDGTMAPGLAEKWGYVGTGNKAFELTLRKGVTFADGTPVNAAAVVATLERYLKTPAPLSHWLYGITGFEAKGDDVVAVKLDKPNPILPLVFSQAANWGDIISPAGLKDTKALANTTHGAGPYTLDSAGTVAGDHYTFVKNPKYYNAGGVTYDKIVLKIIPDQNAALQALKSGQVDIDMNASDRLADQAKAAGADVIGGVNITSAIFLMDRDGVTAPALKDVRVRQALNYAIDRKAVAKALGAAYKPTAQVATEGTDGYVKELDDAYPYDPAKAKALLAEAGYAKGFSFDLVSTALLGGDVVSQAVVSQLAKVGVKVKLKSTGADLNQLIADMASKKFAAVSFNVGGSMFTNALQNFTSPVSPLNPFQSKGAEVLGAFDQLAAAPESELATKAQALNRAAVEQAWFIPVGSNPYYVFTKGVTKPGNVTEGGVVDVLDWKPAS